MDMMTNQVIEEINLFGVYAQRLLNAPGQFNGSFNFDQTGKSNSDLVAATQPGKTWVVMEREGVPIWWGPVWSRTYQSQAKEVQIFAWGFEAYPGQQRMLTDFTETSVDQCQLFIDLWNKMVAETPGRNLSINMPTPPASGIFKSAAILATDDKYYGEVMSTLSDGSDGFDWTVQVTKLANGTYRKDLVMGFPTIGALSTADSLVFEYPGAILNYWETQSMSASGTHILGTGSGEGSTKLTSEVDYDYLIAQGWPRWDFTQTFTEVNDQGILNTLTQQLAINSFPPATSFTVQLKGNVEPIFGSYGLGDYVTLSIKDARNPTGYTGAVRIIGFELRPQSSSQSEEVQLILPGDNAAGG